MNSHRSRIFAAALVACAGLGGSDAGRSQEAGADAADAPDEAARRGFRSAPELGDGPWHLETERQAVRVTVVTKDLERPWGMAFLPNGDVLVTERPGRLRVIRDGKLDPTPIGGLPEIRAAVIGGLQGIALHPDFEDNGLVYVAYTKPDAEEPSVSTLAVARGRYDGGDTLENVEDVFAADDWYGPDMAGDNGRCCGQGPADGSYGARIAFDSEGLLYITSGDRNWGEKAQDPSSHLGKIVRVRDDGSIPDDNPFAGRAGYEPELYTIGHRNPTGLTFDPETGALWSTEFGPRGGDELNRITPGANYGWILVTEGTHYNEEPVALGRSSVEGMTDPVLFWVPSTNPGNIDFYDGDRFPGWHGDLFMAAMSRALVRITLDGDGKAAGQERMLTELGQRLRDVQVGPDGLLYVLTDETAGAMLRIEPAG